jgi:hypothetical protein
VVSCRQDRNEPVINPVPLLLLNYCLRCRRSQYTRSLLHFLSLHLLHLSPQHHHPLTKSVLRVNKTAFIYISRTESSFCRHHVEQVLVCPQVKGHTCPIWLDQEYPGASSGLGELPRGTHRCKGTRKHGSTKPPASRIRGWNNSQVCAYDQKGCPGI